MSELILAMVCAYVVGLITGAVVGAIIAVSVMRNRERKAIQPLTATREDLRATVKNNQPQP